MKRSSKFVIAGAAALALGAAVAVFAQSSPTGPGMMHPMGPGMMHGGPMAAGVQHDDAFRADMGLVHDMLTNHEGIRRTVTNLPDGIRTVTESDDPKVAQTIKAHVASMEKRLYEGKVFNLFSPTLPVLFENKDRIKTVVVATEKGSVVIQTSGDPKVVAALQAHAVEVSELARDGMAAMMRSARASMAQPARSPYAAEQSREIKALSSQEVQSYLSGRGMGLAKAAELNRYPGPAHVLELSDRLGLSAEQKERTRTLFNAMETKAKDLGKTLVEEEARLDRLFASRRISREQLTSSLAEIARLQGELRRVHLEAHLAQTELLDHAQLAKYVELRGYSAADHSGGAGTHRH